jgi:hypothetical protein
MAAAEPSGAALVAPLGRVAGGLLLAAALAALVWYLLSDTAATKREVAARRC